MGIRLTNSSCVSLFRRATSTQTAAAAACEGSAANSGLHKLIAETHEDCGDGYRAPRVSTAQIQPRKFRECDNETLFVMSMHGDYGARKERLVRDVMRVDNISWSEARQKVDGEINRANDSFAWLVRTPSKLVYLEDLLLLLLQFLWYFIVILLNGLMKNLFMKIYQMEVLKILIHSGKSEIGLGVGWNLILVLLVLFYLVYNLLELICNDFIGNHTLKEFLNGVQND